MPPELRDILRSPRGIAFSRVRYVSTYGTEEQRADFLRGLYLKTVEARDTGRWEEVAAYLDEWETWAMDAFGSTAAVPAVEGIPWSPVRKPLSESRVALVTTGGIYVEGQEPYDLDKQGGDFSFREIPRDARREDLRVKHRGYDITGPEADINCVYPLHRFQELEADGIIGELASTGYSFMGLINNTAGLMEETAPEVARRLLEAEVDVAFITAT